MGDGTSHQPVGSPSEIYCKEIVDMYEAGKGRRYALLFSANAGAYLIATFLANFRHSVAGYSVDAIGLIILAAFMILFDLTMWADIDAFGRRLRGIDQSVRRVPSNDKWLLYADPGRRVLTLFSVGLVVAWTFVGLGGVLALAVGLDAIPAAGEPA